VRAAVLRAFGPPERLVAETLPDPVPGPGQVLVETAFASVTFVETQLRAGHPPHPAMAPELPVVLGNGVGGIVAQCGAGVDGSAIGRRVVTTTGGRGGYAERALADHAGLLDVPDGLALQDAIALLADGRTALMLFEAAAIEPGETVLVEAAAGGVGSLLVQLAAGAGARVVAAAGGERKLELARALGAHTTVDYTRPAWTADAGPVDVVFDGVGGAIGRSAFELLREGGRFSAFGMASGTFAGIAEEVAADFGVTLLRGNGHAPAALRAFSERALRAAAAGAIKPVVGQTFALDDAASAHAAIEARATVGKTLLRT
jgi:NADPH2:quinone reductase